MKRLFVTVGVLLVIAAVAVAPAMARPQYCQTFFSTYELNPNQGMFQGKACLVCHVDAVKAKGWNQYGKDFAVALGDVTNSQDRERVVAALRKIESKNSSITKTTYLETIKKGEFPGGNPQ
jgi:hypothetical protein